MSCIPVFQTSIPIKFLCFSILYSNSFPIPVFYSFSLFWISLFQTDLETWSQIKFSFFSVHHNILEFLWFQAKFFLDAFHFCFWKVDTFLELSKFRQYHSQICFTRVSSHELKDNGNEPFPFPSLFIIISSTFYNSKNKKKTNSPLNCIPFLSTDALYLISPHLTRWKA